jgi:hypothetical protein
MDGLSSNPYLGIIGKGGHIRTIPVPEWVKATVDSWTLAASINAGPLLRSINKAGKLWGERLTPKVIWAISSGLPSRSGTLRDTTVSP